ncbi:MAG: hypothetical protein Q4P06_02705 [Actinomycetaceae bacterium]|nr:hypothetical protein [Actinomycetaceae bacterium]
MYRGKSGGRVAVRRRQASQGEDGRIGILLTAGALVVVMVIVVSAAATLVHLQRRQLLACADAIAVTTAGGLQAEGYFQSADLIVDDSAVEERAEAAFNQFQDNACDVGTAASIYEVHVQSDSPANHSDGQSLHSRVVVTVETTVILPLLPAKLRILSQPLDIRVSSATGID